MRRLPRLTTNETPTTIKILAVNHLGQLFFVRGHQVAWWRIDMPAFQIKEGAYWIERFYVWLCLQSMQIYIIAFNLSKNIIFYVVGFAKLPASLL